MYVPTHFDEPRTEVLHSLITENPFGTLFTHGKSGLDANHIPFDLKAGEGACGVLHAHVARANPVWQDVAKFLPATYAALLVQGAMGITPTDPLTLLRYAAFLLISAAVGIVLALRLYRWRGG